MSGSRLVVDADLSMTSLDHALGQLNVDPPAFLIVGEPLRDVAEIIGPERGLTVVVAPEAVMRNRHAWAVATGNKYVYSVPAA